MGPLMRAGREPWSARADGVPLYGGSLGGPARCGAIDNNHLHSIHVARPSVPVGYDSFTIAYHDVIPLLVVSSTFKQLVFNKCKR